MTPTDVIAVMTRDEMARFLESWGFKCDEHDTAEELAEAVVHNCIFEGIDLPQLLRLHEALSMAGNFKHLAPKHSAADVERGK